jgi:hypothetical protein
MERNLCAEKVIARIKMVGANKINNGISFMLWGSLIVKIKNHGGEI